MPLLCKCICIICTFIRCGIEQIKQGKQTTIQKHRSERPDKNITTHEDRKRNKMIQKRSTTTKEQNQNNNQTSQ